MSIINIHDFSITSPPELPWEESDALVQHLVFSMYIKHVWKLGESIIEGIYTRKRNSKRLLTNKSLRLVVRVIRRFARFEILRSSLEGLLFEQVSFLNSPVEIPFQIKGKEADIKLTQVYFSTNIWEPYKYDKEIVFDKQQDLTNTDITHILLYLGLLDYMIKEIRLYLIRVRGNVWKQRAIRYLNYVQKIQRYTTANILAFLKNDE